MTTAGVLDARSMRAWLARYLEWMRVRHHSERYVETARKHLDQFLAWCDTRGLVRPEEITRPMLERYQRFVFHYRQPSGKPLAYGTQHGRLVAIRGFFKWLARNNIILSNPASDLDLPRRQRRLPAHVLTVAEVEKTMTTPNTREPLGLRDRAILEVLWATGMRRIELVGLDLYDVDVERQTVHIRHGKGNKERYVPVGERALAWVEKYVDVVRPELFVGDSEQALFLTRLGERMEPDSLTERVRRYVRESGVGKKGACHLFRHAMATMMLEAGADIRFVQEMLGHAKLDTTAIYTHISIVKLREVYMQTHPAARLGRTEPPGDAPAAEAARAEARELLDDLADEANEEAVLAREPFDDGGGTG
jgi:integrase/recombinase XerD